MLQVIVTLAILIGFVSAGQQERSRQLPPPTDIDPQLTDELRRVERNLSDAILQKDVDALERLVRPDFTVRVADVPEGGMPRAIWLDKTLTKLTLKSVDLRDCTARKLADGISRWSA
jgi:hypothetical protein